MSLLATFFGLSLTLKVASATEAGAANGDAMTAATEDCVAATATNSIIQGRVDALAGVELTVHPDSDLAKTGRGEWIIWPGQGCGQEDLQALVENMPNDTRAVTHGHPERGGLCFFIMEGTREGVWQKLAMHRWSSTPKVETDTAVYFDAQVARESDQLRTVGGLENWGLDRIDQRNDELDNVFEPISKTGGSGVDVYVMDSGIRTSHTEFGGRAVPKLETFEGVSKECKNTDEDCAEDTHGHGTYCAAIVGGKNVGVAPQATLHAVKVHNGTTGSAMNLYRAFDWLLSQDLPTASTVFSLSLNLGAFGFLPPSLASAVMEACDRGITTVLASGNHGNKHNGGWVSHAHKNSAPIEVGAVGKRDKEWESNGKTYDILAPGVGVQSAWITEEKWAWDQIKGRVVRQEVPSDTGKKTFDGTSAAAPHVAGAAALLLSEAKSRGKAFSPGAVKKTLMEHGSDFCKGKLCYDKRVMLYIGKKKKYDKYEMTGWMWEAEVARQPENRSGSNTLPPWGKYEKDKEFHLVLR